MKDEKTFFQSFNGWDRLVLFLCVAWLVGYAIAYSEYIDVYFVGDEQCRRSKAPWGCDQLVNEASTMTYVWLGVPFTVWFVLRPAFEWILNGFKRR